jgi:hypothetical protein
MNEKYCKDCKHYYINTETERFRYGVCKKTVRNDLVSGNEIMEDCHLMRWDDYKCGISGQWFEPKL